MADLYEQVFSIARDNETHGDTAAASMLGGALRAVIELHAPVTFVRHQLDVPICEACSASDDLHDVPAPCETVRAIARELGIEAA